MAVSDIPTHCAACGAPISTAQMYGIIFCEFCGSRIILGEPPPDSNQQQDSTPQKQLVIPEGFYKFSDKCMSLSRNNQIFLAQKVKILNHTDTSWNENGLIFTIQKVIDYTENHKGEVWTWREYITECQGRQFIFAAEMEDDVPYLSMCAPIFDINESDFLDGDDEYKDDIEVFEKLYEYDYDGNAKYIMLPDKRKGNVEYCDYLWEDDDSWWFKVVYWDKSDKFNCLIGQDLKPRWVYLK